MNDDELLVGAIAGAREGDEASVAELFRALQPRLIRYLRHRAPGEAEDLAAETWMAVAKGIRGFEGGVVEFRAWLFSIARRRVADHYRSASRRPSTRWRNPACGPDDEADLEASASPGGDPADAVVEEISAQEAVRRLAGDLPPDQAEVVLLRVVAGLPVEQVAEILALRPGTVRVLQHRALRRLAKTWERV